MKRLLVLFVAIGLLLAMSSTAMLHAEQKIVLKLAHDLMEDTPQHLGALDFKARVEEASNGRVEVQIFPSGQLGTDIETAEMLQTGVLQASLIPTAKLSGFDAALQVMDLPFLFTDRAVMYAVFDDPEFRKLLFDPLENIGLKGISIWESGFKQFTANKKIESPADFSGQKFRVMESPLLIAQFEALGANPVPIDFAETYNALQQRVVDGQENPLVSITKMRFHEVQTNIMISNHGYLGYAFLMSNAFWSNLPEDLKTVIQTAADLSAQYERKLSEENEGGYIKTIEDYGREVTYLTKEQLDVFAEAMKPVHEQFRDVIGSNVLDTTYALIEKHTAN